MSPERLRIFSSIFDNVKKVLIAFWHLKVENLKYLRIGDCYFSILLIESGASNFFNFVNWFEMKLHWGFPLANEVG